MNKNLFLSIECGSGVIQSLADSVPNIRENYGPFVKHKSGKDVNVGGHNCGFIYLLNNCKMGWKCLICFVVVSFFMNRLCCGQVVLSTKELIYFSSTSKPDVFELQLKGDSLKTDLLKASFRIITDERNIIYDTTFNADQLISFEFHKCIEVKSWDNIKCNFKIFFEEQRFTNWQGRELLRDSDNVSVDTSLDFLQIKRIKKNRTYTIFRFYTKDNLIIQIIYIPYYKRCFVYSICC